MDRYDCKTCCYYDRMTGLCGVCMKKMADAYKMEADKIREAIGESGLEQMKKDMAVQKAVTVIADAAVEVEKAADAE